MAKKSSSGPTVYLDVSCLNRPFDDQSQIRIRLEAEAVVLILERVEGGQWAQVSSEMALITAIGDADRRARVRLLLPGERDISKLTPSTFQRAATLQQLGFKPADALHVAAAEEAGADVFLSCDDRLCRTARRHRQQLKIPVANPLEWIKEQENATNP